MHLFLHTCLGWMRRNLTWSNSRKAWQERIAIVLCLASAAAVWWYRDVLSLLQQAVLWALLSVALAVSLWRGWIKLFGPVLFYDMIRTGRRGRYFVPRVVYAVSLLLIVFVVYLIQGEGHDIPENQMARFTEIFFQLFLVVQFAFIVILTPAYTAGAIAEEKDRRTLEFMFATDLRNREIVLSMLVSRSANLLLLAMTGLPILALLQFWAALTPTCCSPVSPPQDSPLSAWPP